ncbi:MAG: MFS transporter [Bacteroidetes bacterium]|nr:MFS transporter [Bacteroidota bacterium]
MTHGRIKLSLFLNYFVIAMLLNSVGTVILQVQNSYGVSESSASVLEACKDLSIALVSFLVASYITRIGYKKAMLIALGLVGTACLAMPSLGSFFMTKVLFVITGTSFALIKVSVYATMGIITTDKKEHASFMNFIESFFMVGILIGYFVFSAFVNDADKQSTSWLNVYYLCAAIALAAFLLLLSAPLDETSVRADESKPLLKDFTDMIKLAAQPLVLIFIVSAFTYVLIEQSIMSWLPTFNSKVLNLPSTLSIQMASILAASTAVGRFSAGFALRKIHWFYVLVICLVAASVLVLVAIPLARSSSGVAVTGWGNAPLGAFVFPLIGLLIAPIYPAINSVILGTLPARQHGPMSGLIVIFSALGGTTGSIITGNMFQVFGGEVAFYSSLVPITILIVCLYFFNRLQKKSAAHIVFKTASH